MRPRHPKYGDIDAPFIVDSITNRLNGEEYGPKINANGFSAHIVLSLLERATKTKQRKVKQVYFFIGVNVCLSAQFDLKEVSSYSEILIFTVSHKICPENMTTSTVFPLVSFCK